MPIRKKNLDLTKNNMKGHDQIPLGDLNTATDGERILFVAPYACTLDFIDIYAGSGFSGNATSTLSFRVQLAGASASTLAQRGTTACDAGTNDIDAYTRYRLIPSSNNSLSRGQTVVMDISAACAANLSGVTCHVTYTANVHTEA